MKKTNLQFNELIMAMRDAIEPETYRRSDYPPRDAMVDIAILWRDSEGCSKEITRFWGLRHYGTLVQDNGDFSSLSSLVKVVYKIQCASDGSWSIEKI